MKKEKTKSPKNKAPQQDEDRWVNVHDESVMHEMGLLRFIKRTPRDKSVWTKTPYEKRLLKKLRHSCKGKDMHFHTLPRTIIRTRGKLIINLRKNKRFNKTTYSTECWQHEIPDILSKYQVNNRKTGYSENVVRKYSWNGKTYNTNDLPTAW